MDRFPSTILVLALCTVLGACRPPASESSASPSTATALPTTIVVTTPAPPSPSALPADGWLRMSIPASDWIGLMAAVVTTDSGLVAVGSPVCAMDDDTNCQASAWTATTIDAWTRVADQPSLAMNIGSYEGPGLTGLFDVALGPAGLVAIGHPGEPYVTGVWRSSDGQAWERSTVNLGFDDIRAVAAGPLGYVMVGTDPLGDGKAHATAWASADGLTWTRADDTADMDVGPCLATGEAPICGGMLGVVATATGFVAVGHVRSGEGAKRSQPMTWTSPDGLTWTRSGDGLDVQGEFLGIVAVGHRFVAVGFECRPDCIDYRHDGLVATSADGLTWQVQALPTAAILSDVAGAGSRVFALGDVNAEQGPRAELQLWESDGGGDWHLVATSPTIPGTHSYRGYDLAVSADGAVTIVGWIENDDFQNFAYTRP